LYEIFYKPVCKKFMSLNCGETDKQTLVATFFSMSK